MCPPFIWITLLVFLFGCTPTPPPEPPPVLVHVVPPDKNNPPALGAQKYQRTLTREARAVYGLDAPIAVFAAQIHQESGWNEKAVSPVGAQGIAQFMPSTATGVSKDFPQLGPASPTDPEWSIRAMILYMHQIDSKITADNECHHHAFDLVGYNGGYGWVFRDQKLAAQKNLDPNKYWDNVELVNAGRNSSAWNENRQYPDRIIKTLQSRYASWGRMVCM